MHPVRILAASAMLAALTAALPAFTQQPAQPQLKIDSTNRTLAVSASATVSVEPDVAILHIGFETQPTGAKAAYADGARTSNAIVDALKQAGIAETDIRSQSQYLEPDFTEPKSHKFRLAQQWTVRTTPARAAEILDVAVTAGATSSGEIDWTVKDEQALEEQALDKATARAKADAEALAKGMGVRLGAPIYVSNQIASFLAPRPFVARTFALSSNAPASPPLAVEPQKVTRSASIYAVYAIE
ncbi:MAG: SIMPL domain-containing protein [Terracidiphilus sp.]